MASLRSKCTTNSNINNNNINNTTNKSYPKNLDLISGSNQNTLNGQQNSSRLQLRWSQSFSPTDRQKPNVSTLIRRKSAVERLAETKYNYIKCSPVDNDVNDKHKYIQKSLSTGKTPLVILSQTLSQSPAVLLSNININNQILNQSQIKCDQNIQSSAQTTSSQVVTRKRNSSLSSRLSEGSNNLEIQLRQLIADNEDNTESDLFRINSNNNNKNISKDSVIKSTNKTIETPVKPKPKERINTTNSSNKQIIRQTTPTVVTNPRNITTNKTNIINSNSVETTNKKTNTNPILRSSSSHKTVNCKPIPSKPTATARQKSTPLSNTFIYTNINSSSNSKQLSISRSKSDVSNRLLVRRNKSKDEIERFFETLGLDSSVWDSIRSEATNSLISTPPHYFDSCESFQSGHIRHVHMSSSSSHSSIHSTTNSKPNDKQSTQLNTRLMQSRSCHALSEGTSIVEKNARVIKWLYNCRKAMVQL